MARLTTQTRANTRRSRIANRSPRTASRSTPRAGRPRRWIPTRNVARHAARSPTVRKDSRKAAHQAEVQAFLDRFTHCLTTGDGNGAAACFELPALMVMADTRYGPSQVLSNTDVVSGFFADAPRQYAEKGILSTFPEIDGLEWLDDGLGLVHVHFPYIDAHGNDRGDGERSLYVLRRDANGELAICTAIALGVDSERNAKRRGKPRPAGTEGDHLA